MAEPSPAIVPDRYLTSIIQQSQTLGLQHQEQIRRDQERLQEAVTEFEHLKAIETKRLQESVQLLHQEFRDSLARLQDEFVAQAREASDKFRNEVRNRKRQYERKLETRAREMALELRTSSPGSEQKPCTPPPPEPKPWQKPPRIRRRPAPANSNSDEDKVEPQPSTNESKTVPKTYGLILDWLAGSHSISKRPESSPDEDGRNTKLQTNALTNRQSERDEENVKTEILERRRSKSPDLNLKPIIARRQALSARTQLPALQSQEISFVKSRLQSFVQSLDRSDFDEDEIVRKAPNHHSRSADPGRHRSDSENDEPRISEGFRQRILAQSRRRQS